MFVSDKYIRTAKSSIYVCYVTMKNIINDLQGGNFLNNNKLLQRKKLNSIIRMKQP